MSLESATNVVQTQVYRETPRTVERTESAVVAEVSSNDVPLQQISIQPVFAGSEEDGQKQEKNQANDKQLQMAVSDANNKMKHAKTKAEFSYHEPTKSISIKIMDEDTNEVIKEIPPQETLDMIVKMWELAGIMVDEKR